MQFLLDTNIVSELRKANRCDRAVAEWSTSTPLIQQWLSVISLFELRLGIALKQQKDKKASAALLEWYINQVKPCFAGRILAITESISEYAALFHVPKTRAFRDSLIAATAKQHNLIVVTRNIKDFTSFDVPVMNPWLFNKS